MAKYCMLNWISASTFIGMREKGGALDIGRAMATGWIIYQIC